jgi:transcription antitermination factor NusG
MASISLIHRPVETQDAFRLERGERQWFAAYTCARHEKRVAEMLEAKSVEGLLPLHETVHRWKNGLAKVQLPLFPGYIFVHIALQDRRQVLEVPSVVRLVGFNGQPAPLPEADIEAIRSCLERGRRLEPHPYLQVGQRVRVVCGPLQGTEGILLRRMKRTRLVISLELIMRSVAVEMDEASLEPVR